MNYLESKEKQRLLLLQHNCCKYKAMANAKSYTVNQNTQMWTNHLC